MECLLTKRRDDNGEVEEGQMMGKGKSKNVVCTEGKKNSHNEVVSEGRLNESKKMQNSCNSAI